MIQNFINDETAIGKWEYYTTIRNGERFDPDKIDEVRETAVFNEIYFLPNGEKYWIFEGWTKGKLYVHYGGDEPVLCYSYEIRLFNEKHFMFLTSSAEDSHIEVLIKTSSKRFSLYEIGRRDNIEVPFVFDEAIIGNWKSVGFVRAAEDFTGQEQNDLWLKSIVFYENGEVSRVYADEVWKDSWTKGLLIDKKKSVLSSYFFKQINGKEYLFLEWKMGNYVYGNCPPDYYVFSKRNQL